MLLIEGYAAPGAHADGRLVLAFEFRQKSRLRTRLDSGEEVGLFMPRGTILRGGDRLQGNDGRVVLVVAAPESLMQVDCASPPELARAAYHLGNRHVAVEIGPGWLRFCADPILRTMLTGLGAAVTEVTAPFEPEAGAYGSGHTHGPEGEHGGIIHSYGARRP